MASRKGFEPLTYGLGNRCSILLSYRDAALWARQTYHAGTRAASAARHRSVASSSLQLVEREARRPSKPYAEEAEDHRGSDVEAGARQVAVACQRQGLQAE
jgi:hypothetical protein